MRADLELPDDMFPVQSFFNALGRVYLKQALLSFASGHGYYPEDKTCDFPADLAEEEGGPPERFNYIEFWTYNGNEDVRIDFNTFLNVLDQVVDAQIEVDKENQADWDLARQAVHKKVNEIKDRAQST